MFCNKLKDLLVYVTALYVSERHCKAVLLCKRNLGLYTYYVLINIKINIINCEIIRLENTVAD